MNEATTVSTPGVETHTLPDDNPTVAPSLTSPISSTPGGPIDPIPARMLNEWAYCPRLAYLEWVQGEWADSADTLDGEFVHRNVDREDRKPLTANGEEEGRTLHRRSLRLENEELGLVAVVDVLEVEGNTATPVDYKRGAVPDLPEEAWEPDRVQLCTQALLLRAAGFTCNEGAIYYSASKTRVDVVFDDVLIERTLKLIEEFRRAAELQRIPLPLIDSPKCPRCSLVGICLPDETRLLAELQSEESATDLETLAETEESAEPVRPKRSIRLALVPRSDARPLHVVEQGAKVCKSGERINVQFKDKPPVSCRLVDISQVCVYGGVQITTQALTELIDRDIPICYFTTSGWFRGISMGLAHRNVELRIRQYAVGTDPVQSLIPARAMIGGKIRNCRTILRRNMEEDPERILDRLEELAGEVDRAKSLESLLGLEGMAAKVYFSGFAKLIRTEFSFSERNRRPPTDPVNAVLSFLYSLLTKEVHVALYAVGFDPMLGFLHQPRYGRPALALDMAEEFRPLLADSVTLSLFNTRELNPDHFVTRVGACALTPAGRRAVLGAWERRLNTEITHPLFDYALSYRRLLPLQARLLSRYLLGEFPKYPAFKTR